MLCPHTSHPCPPASCAARSSPHPPPARPQPSGRSGTLVNLILSAALPLPALSIRATVTDPSVTLSWTEGGGRGGAERASVQDQQRKQQWRAFLGDIMRHSLTLREAARGQRLVAKTCAHAARKKIEREERSKDRAQENEEKERVKALKANNMDAYLELVRKSKNERITFLLSQTDTYLSSLSTLVGSQKDSNARFEAEAEERAAAQAEKAAKDREGKRARKRAPEAAGEGGDASSASSSGAPFWATLCGTR